MEQNLHVEIGFDGKRLVSRLEGCALELMAAALRCVNLFYTAFEEAGESEFFQRIMRDAVMDENGPVWTYKHGD